MKSYHRLGSVFGIEIGVHISWYIIFIMLSFSLGAGYFPGVVPGGSRLDYVLMGIIAALLLFVSVLAHELAHSLVARSFRLKIDRIYLFFFGGISQIGEDGLSPKSEMFMAAAGPVFSLAVGAVCFLLVPLISAKAVSAIFAYLARLNIVLGFFNMLPGFPLDGGRVLRAVLWWKTGRFDIATACAAKSGKFLGFLLGVSGLISIFLGDLGGLWVALIGGFLFVMAESSFEQMLLKRSLSSKSVMVVLEAKPLYVSSDIGVDRLVNEYFLRLPLDHVPVIEGGKFRGVVELDRVVHVRPEVRGSIKVKDVMVPSSRIPALSSHDSLYHALERMSSLDIDVLPVMEGKRLLGVVTRESLIHFLRASALSRHLPGF